jgi:hypothetical protein
VTADGIRVKGQQELVAFDNVAAVCSKTTARLMRWRIGKTCISRLPGIEQRHECLYRTSRCYEEPRSGRLSIR